MPCHSQGWDEGKGKRKGHPHSGTREVASWKPELLIQGYSVAGIVQSKFT